MRDSLGGPGRRLSPARLLVVAPIPVLIFIGHLVGGAATPGDAALMTGAVGLASAWTLFSSRAALPLAASRLLARPALTYGALIILAAASAAPGSNLLAQGEWAAIVGGSTLAIDPPAALAETLKLLGLAVVFLSALACAATPARLQTCLAVIFGLGLMWTLWSLVLFAVETAGGGAARLTGAFGSPNAAAAVLAGLILTGIALAQFRLDARRPADRPRPPGHRLPQAAAGLVLLAALLLTASRSAVTALLIIGALAMLRPAARRWRKGAKSGRPLALVGGGVAALIVAVVTGSHLMSRFGGALLDGEDRRTIVSTYADAAAASPWFGYGPGSLPALTRLLLTPENYGALWNVRAAHNLPVQWWAEMGLLGLVLGASTLVVLIGVIVRGLDAEGRRTLWPLLAFTGFMLGQGLVDYPAQIYSIALFWAFLLGLLFGVAVAGQGYWPKRARRD